MSGYERAHEVLTVVFNGLFLGLSTIRWRRSIVCCEKRTKGTVALDRQGGRRAAVVIRDLEADPVRAGASVDRRGEDAAVLRLRSNEVADIAPAPEARLLAAGPPGQDRDRSQSAGTGAETNRRKNKTIRDRRCHFR